MNLFESDETLSPREQWCRKYEVTTAQIGDEWTAKSPFGDIVAKGGSRDEVVAELAAHLHESKHIPLWNQ